ncbi:Ribonuclease P protein component [bioreactor metagenome]|uniref:Ribonuclease P protein component n=1 Tax=bioreactor metagenome TaxID=1076179 RepID=A0A644WIR5_9ZZZZ
MLCRHLSSHSETGGFQVLFSVPKKKIPKAVDRNRIKRRLREAWRLNAGTLRNTCTSSRVLLQVGIYYQSDVVLPFSDLEAKIKTLIKRLSKHHETSDR